MLHLSQQSPGVSLKADCKIMCLRQCPPENTQPCKTFSIVILCLMWYRNVHPENGKVVLLDMECWKLLCWWWLQRLSWGMSRRQQSLVQREHVGRCLWLCKTCTGDDGPLVQRLKAGCSSPLTFENWRILLCLKEAALPWFILGRARAGEKCAWPPKEDFLLAPLLLWSNRSG